MAGQDVDLVTVGCFAMIHDVDHRMPIAIVLALVLSASSLVHAQKSQTYTHISSMDGITAAEYASLPQYCPRTERGWSGLPPDSDVPPKTHWVALMGEENFIHMHHYCQGLVHISRGNRIQPPQHKQAHWQQAVHEFDYVLRRARPDFVLLPEILTKRAIALQSLNKIADAMNTYRQAIEARVNYWPAYVGLAKLHKTIGESAKAIDVVKTGLEHAPDSKALIALLTELDPRAKPAPRTPAAKPAAANAPKESPSSDDKTDGRDSGKGVAQRNEESR